MSLAIQEAWLKRTYAEGKTHITQSRLYWEGDLSPSAISPKYRVLLTYSLNSPPEVFVLKPDLTKNDQGKLPHVYSVRDQKLCLHFPPEKAWHTGKVLALIFVPWISEWLYFYEIWVATDKWMGGGTHREDNDYRDMHYAV